MHSCVLESRNMRRLYTNKTLSVKKNFHIRPYIGIFFNNVFRHCIGDYTRQYTITHKIHAFIKGIPSYFGQAQSPKM